MNEHTYTIDPNHSSVRFWVRHLMISKVHGEFSSISGTVIGSFEDAANARVEVTIEAAGLNTGNEARDAHLTSPDFLDVEQFPAITFKSTSISKTGEDSYDVTGDLTMHGVTRPVTLKTEVTPEIPSPFGGFKVGVSSTATIDRGQFGMTWNQAIESGGVMVGKEIHLMIDLELDRP
jgi:polyisoprenoid-binding protein YceI